MSAWPDDYLERGLPGQVGGPRGERAVPLLPPRTTSDLRHSRSRSAGWCSGPRNPSAADAELGLGPLQSAASSSHVRVGSEVHHCVNVNS